MDTPNLDQLWSTLKAIDAAEVRAPSGMPIATIVSEAATLDRLVQKPPVRQRLMSVGLPEQVLDEFPLAVGAAAEAQSIWVQFRDRSHSVDLKTTVADSEKLRTEMREACRWNLRKNAAAQSSLDLIQRGDGTADLAQDLHDLAGLVENNLDAFTADETFDAAAAVSRARQLRAELLGEAASEHHAFDRKDAKEQRDRAFTHLDAVVDEIRQCGRYAYKGDEDMTTRFTSGYYRRRRTGSEEPAEPTDADAPVVDADQPAPADA